MFDFDTQPNRDGLAASKWLRRTDAEKALGIVPMSVADMEFLCAPCVVRAVERVARFGVYGYTDADDVYLSAVAGWMEKRHAWRIEKEWIVPENGVIPAMTVAIRAFTEPGDAVLIQSPGYPPFESTVKENGRVPLFNPLRQTEDGAFLMDLDDLRSKAKHPLTKMMFLCSPHNPVGRIWTAEELRAVAQICLENDVLLISDEIHFDLEINGRHTVLAEAAPEVRERCIVLTAPSKTFNTAGLQAANIIIPDATLRSRYQKRLQGDGYSNLSLFGYHATVAAYNEGAPWVDAMLAYVRDNFAYLGGWLHKNLPMVKLTPAQGTYLAWLDFRAPGWSEAELESFVREEAMLVGVPGARFCQDGEGFVRLNLALPRRELEKALDRLLAAARGLKIV